MPSHLLLLFLDNIQLYSSSFSVPLSKLYSSIPSSISHVMLKYICTLDVVHQLGPTNRITHLIWNVECLSVECWCYRNKSHVWKLVNKDQVICFLVIDLSGLSWTNSKVCHSVDGQLQMYAAQLLTSCPLWKTCVLFAVICSSMHAGTL